MPADLQKGYIASESKAGGAEAVEAAKKVDEVEDADCVTECLQPEAQLQQAVELYGCKGGAGICKSTAIRSASETEMPIGCAHLLSQV